MLNDCLRRVLDIYDSHSDAPSDLMDSIFALHFIHGSEGILRLISLHSLKRYTVFSKHIHFKLLIACFCFSFNKPSFHSLAVEIIFAHGLGNYSKFFRLFKALPAPLACALARHLPALRRQVAHLRVLCRNDNIFEFVHRNAWLTMSTAYSSKVLKVPIQYLAKVCMLPSVDDAAAELKHYGMACDGANVHFQRNNFDLQAKLVSTALLVLCFI